MTTAHHSSSPRSVRSMLEHRGIISVAADGFKAPSVVVSFTDNPDVKTGKAFAAVGVQTAAGVPLQVQSAAPPPPFSLCVSEPQIVLFPSAKAHHHIEP